MYKIKMHGITIDRILNNLVISAEVQTKIKYDLIYKGCNGDKTIISLGDFGTGHPLNLSDIYQFFGGEESNGIYVFKFYHVDYVPFNDEIYITNYGLLLNKIIKGVKGALCTKCECSECDCLKSNKKCVKNQELLTNILHYIGINKPFYTSSSITYTTDIHLFIQKAIFLYKCYIDRQKCNTSGSSKIYGEVEYNEDLVKLFISIYYLSIYFHHKYSISELSTADIVDLNTYFNFNRIKGCFPDIININELEDIYIGNPSSGDYLDNVFTFTGSPLIGEMGREENVTLTYDIKSNDDIITTANIYKNSVLLLNVLSNIDLGIQNVTVPAIKTSQVFKLGITYTRKSLAMAEEINLNYSAVIPQWVGRSFLSDFEGKTYAEIESDLIKYVQDTATIETDLFPQDHYLWFISSKPNARITDSGFNVTIGNWTDGTTFFIKKTVTITLFDNITTAQVTFYRTREKLTHSEQTYKIY